MGEEGLVFVMGSGHKASKILGISQMIQVSFKFTSPWGHTWDETDDTHGGPHTASGWDQAPEEDQPHD